MKPFVRNSVSKTKAVVPGLHDQGIVATGGFIVGNPDDRPEDIREAFRFAGEIGLDHVILQCLTPYPKTEIRNLKFIYTGWRNRMFHSTHRF